MEEKDRMWAEYDRLRRWIHHLENMISGERVGRLSFEPQELEKLEEMLKKGCQRLGQLRKRLGIAEIGLPWFQFYEIVEDGFTQFLPEQYRDYKVQIGPVKRKGWIVDALQLEKEGAPDLPALEIKKYADQVSDGADAWRMLGRMADDYKRLICPEKKHQMER